ncbi:MAG: hypothetical protein KatS3mg023_2666 [Armatimonadota bacterium]|nr:MAG: hypothetical protein KatS3mg023_2666 [Armatimonadota bacterium]
MLLPLSESTQRKQRMNFPFIDYSPVFIGSEYQYGESLRFAFGLRRFFENLAENRGKTP